MNQLVSVQLLWILNYCHKLHVSKDLLLGRGALVPEGEGYSIITDFTNVSGLIPSYLTASVSGLFRGDIPNVQSGTYLQNLLIGIE